MGEKIAIVLIILLCISIISGLGIYFYSKSSNPDEPSADSITEPAEPVKPAEPAKPTEPIKPVEPAKPVKPTEPIKPVEPAKPVKPVETVVKLAPSDPKYDVFVTKLTTSDINNATRNDLVQSCKMFSMSLDHCSQKIIDQNLADCDKYGIKDCNGNTLLAARAQDLTPSNLQIKLDNWCKTNVPDKPFARKGLPENGKPEFWGCFGDSDLNKIIGYTCIRDDKWPAKCAGYPYSLHGVNKNTELTQIINGK